MFKCLYVYVYVHKFMHHCIHTSYICTNTHQQVHMDALTLTCIRKHTHAHAHVHTNTHAHTRRLNDTCMYT